MVDVEIGIGKSGRRGYALDEIVVVPSRRTRDASDVDLSWRLDAFDFALPLMVAPSDGAVSPRTAIEIGRLGGLAVLDLDGLWTRYEEPGPLFEEIAALAADRVTRRLQELYAAPVRPGLVRERIREVAQTGTVTCGAVTPQRAAEIADVLLEAELEILVIRGTVVSAEHVSKGNETLDLTSFIRRLDIPVVVGGCASYQAALHLMRTGAVGVLVGVGSQTTSTTPEVLGIGAPQATAIADVAGARTRHLEETGVYVQVVADGGFDTGADIVKAIACGADAVMVGSPVAAATESPGLGFDWGVAASHPSLPKSTRIAVPRRGTLEEILVGPGSDGHGRTNLFGSLRGAMASCGYADVRSFNKADVVVAPSGRRPGTWRPAEQAVPGR
ncbi:MAG TPA: GuaB3 family IMP dehydrogenase-related protein [Acidimicrobiales bacterium]|nr:GuaB3 family IMP dehydrogenase-related protein [Acidimicrobiales bacterium]